MSKFEIYKGKGKGDEVWRWRLVDNWGDKIARSEEPFKKGSIAKSIKKLQKKVVDAPVYLDEGPEDKDKGNRFEFYQSAAGKWRWRFKAGNHEIMAISSKGYESDCEVMEMIEHFVHVISVPVVIWKEDE